MGSRLSPSGGSLKGVLSTSNSSTATLAGGAVFTGIGEDVSEFSSVSVLYKSDVAEGSFQITFFTTGGTTTETPIINFAIIKGSDA